MPIHPLNSLYHYTSIQPLNTTPQQSFCTRLLNIPFNTPTKHPLSTYPLNIPSQYTLSTHPRNTPPQPTSSTHPLNPPSQHTSSTHLLNTPSQHRSEEHTLSTHPLNSLSQLTLSPTSATHPLNVGPRNTPTRPRSVKAMRAHMEASVQHMEELRVHATASLLLQLETTRQKTTQQSKLAALKKLRWEVMQAEQEAETEERAENVDRLTLLDTVVDLKVSSEACAMLLSQITTSRGRIFDEQQDLAKSLYLLDARQLKLLKELSLVYPILHLESGDYSIRGA